MNVCQFQVVGCSLYMNVCQFEVVGCSLYMNFCQFQVVGCSLYINFCQFQVVGSISNMNICRDKAMPCLYRLEFSDSVQIRNHFVMQDNGSAFVAIHPFLQTYLTSCKIFHRIFILHSGKSIHSNLPIKPSLKSVC